MNNILKTFLLENIGINNISFNILTVRKDFKHIENDLFNLLAFSLSVLQSINDSRSILYTKKVYYTQTIH